MLLCSVLLLLGSSVVDIPSIYGVSTVVGIYSVVGVHAVWLAFCFSVHGVVRVSAVVIFLLKSLRKKIEAVFLNF
jgi:hypothetical protein